MSTCIQKLWVVTSKNTSHIPTKYMNSHIACIHSVHLTQIQKQLRGTDEKETKKRRWIGKTEEE